MRRSVGGTPRRVARLLQAALDVPQTNLDRDDRSCLEDATSPAKPGSSWSRGGRRGRDASALTRAPGVPARGWMAKRTPAGRREKTPSALRLVVEPVSHPRGVSTRRSLERDEGKRSVQKRSRRSVRSVVAVLLEDRVGRSVAQAVPVVVGGGGLEGRLAHGALKPVGPSGDRVPVAFGDEPDPSEGHPRWPADGQRRAPAA